MSRYHLHEKIGQGRWGAVYRATDPLTPEQPVAVKVIDRLHGIPKSELLIGRRITDPHVCRIFDYYRDENGNHCLAMEYAAGGNLARWIQQNAPASWSQCRPIVMQMLQGLAAAHKEGIVHRDLKPENILFHADGRVLLSDFGHARPVGSVPRAESLPQLGSMDYMAPEQSKAFPCAERADLFSFGVVLQEMLTGQLPDSLKPGPLPRQIPRRVRAVIRRCLQTQIEDRFASTEEVNEALSRYVKEGNPAPTTFHLFSYGFTASVAIVILFIIGIAWQKIDNWGIEPPFRLVAQLPEPVPLKDRPGLILNFTGPAAPLMEKAMIAGGKYEVVDRDYLDSNLAKLKKPDATGILGATFSLSGKSYLTDQGRRLHINASLIRIQNMTVVTSQGVEGDPVDAVRLAEQLAKRF